MLFTFYHIEHFGDRLNLVTPKLKKKQVQKQIEIHYSVAAIVTQTYEATNY